MLSSGMTWLLWSSAHSSSGYTQKSSQPKSHSGEADALHSYSVLMSSWQTITVGLGELSFTGGVATVRFPMSSEWPHSLAHVAILTELRLVSAGYFVKNGKGT